MNFFSCLTNRILTSSSSSSSQQSVKTKEQEKIEASIEQNKLLKKQTHFPFDFDRWYPSLTQFTFPSVIIPINPATAKALVLLYKQLFHRPKEPLFQSQHRKLLQSLEKQLQQVISEHFTTTPFFVRMSNRSPKDGIPIASIHSPETFLARTKQIMENTTLDDNTRMIELCETQMQDLKCITVQDCIQLIVTSERVFMDLL